MELGWGELGINDCTIVMIGLAFSFHVCIT